MCEFCQCNSTSRSHDWFGQVPSLSLYAITASGYSPRPSSSGSPIFTLRALCFISDRYPSPLPAEHKLYHHDITGRRILQGCCAPRRPTLWRRVNTPCCCSGGPGTLIPPFLCSITTTRLQFDYRPGPGFATMMFKHGLYSRKQSAVNIFYVVRLREPLSNDIN